MLKPCTGAALLAVLDRIPCLAGPGRRVEELSGGLTNRNLKVTTDDGVYVARCTQGDPELLGIDRDHEHLNTVAAWHAGVGRRSSTTDQTSACSSSVSWTAGPTRTPTWSSPGR